MLIQDIVPREHDPMILRQEPTKKYDAKIIRITTN